MTKALEKKYPMSGFTIIRNGQKLDFPFLESIQSLLPLVDELIVAYGPGEDNTLEKLHTLKSKKLKIFESTWDLSNQKGGMELSRQTDLALERCSYDLCFYLQADEVLHEDDYSQLLKDIAEFENDESCDLLLLQWRHFFGHYSCLLDSPKWYRREGRVLKKSRGLKSYLDAQGFRVWNEQLQSWSKGRALESKARIFHYGWVRSPEKMAEKSEDFNRFWHGNARDGSFKLDTMFPLQFGMTRYTGTHPSVMHSRIQKGEGLATFSHYPNGFWDSPLLYLRRKIEHITGWRVGEFQNYRRIRKAS